MQVLLVQPPFVQLNSPYPATAYLASFLRREGHTARIVDLSIELFRRIFCSAGFARVFAEAGQRLTDRLGSFDAPTRENLLRYLSNADRYVESIDRIVELLALGDDALAHAMTTTGRVPWGHRSEGFLEANEGVLQAADAPILASLIVEDIADFIRFSLDPEFSLVRYAESKASSQPDFRIVEAAARDSWLFEAFFRPLAAETVSALGRPDLVCVTVPFPGTLPGALAFAGEAKRVFGRNLPVAFGGGYVSTELRALRDTGIFTYTDFLCYDAGFGALAAILEHLRTGEDAFHKTIVLREGRLAAHGFDGADLERFRSEPLYEICDSPQFAAWRAVDERAIREVFPDYAGLDFSRYVRIVEGTNPMHALWSDTKWLKARLSHGCYWRRCAFCDTTLEYIARFAPSSPERLHAHLAAQAEATGQRGIHFVDEALPVPHLVRFALENLRRGRPLRFWGNARLDRRLTPDACAVLAEGGLVGLSAGLEIATDQGLEKTRKGITLEGAVAALAALEANGILAHAYLIYGWPGQPERDLVDSMEIVRQLFAAGLVDSAFWHRFILTRHSPIYAEWKAGLRSDLSVIEPEWTFGSNDLAFEGEDRFERYGPGLDEALGAWMEGEGLGRPASAWFAFKVAKPSFPADCVDGLARAARRRHAAPGTVTGKRAIWLGGRLIAEEGRGGREEVRLAWSYRNRLHRVALEPRQARALVEAIAAAGPDAGSTMDELLAAMTAVGSEPFETTKAFRKLRVAGLAAV
ncbi:MAG: radical SAM protein [Spirochaetes bacterium]|nr:radical SAM protein [Spirochaetota bacterium]